MKNNVRGLNNETTSQLVFKFLLILSVSFCAFGLAMDGVSASFGGLYTIVTSKSGLITDYIALAGIGGAFLNSGLVMLMTLILFKRVRLPFFGASIACVFLMGGFALFGKNVYNIISIILGGYLYSKVQREPFSRYAYAVIFGTTLAPAVNEISFIFDLPLVAEIVLMNLFGILIGFVIPSVSSHTIRAHQGYNLYNVGMAAGLVGLVLTAIFRSFGYEFKSNLYWSEEYNLEIAVFFGIIFIAMIILGFYLNDNSLKGMKHFFKHSGRAVADYISLEGVARTFINMGALGVMAIAYVFAVGGSLSGPAVGGVLTVVGFGAFGKHIKNVIPIVAGVVLASFAMDWSLNEPSMILAGLFSTGLAPIAGQFGIVWGLIAGFIHSAVVRDVGALHGFLNLYNNGFAEGLICIVLVPIIEALRDARE